MVVLLIILGTATKLALAVAATYRTPLWWTPGAVSVALGALASTHDGRVAVVGHAAVMLGLFAVLLARAARAGQAVR